jgi:hypothetical protein
VEGTGLGFGGSFTTVQVFNLVVARLLKNEGVRFGRGLGKAQASQPCECRIIDSRAASREFVLQLVSEEFCPF